MLYACANTENIKIQYGYACAFTYDNQIHRNRRKTHDVSANAYMDS